MIYKGQCVGSFLNGNNLDLLLCCVILGTVSVTRKDTPTERLGIKNPAAAVCGVRSQRLITAAGNPLFQKERDTGNLPIV